MSNQHYFDVPFAFSGDVTAIPDPLQSGGTVSFTEGWNYNYQRDLATDPAALPIDRSTMNWLLLQITTALQALQKETVPEFILASQNGGTAIAYGPQAVVLWSASGNAPFTKYVNISGATNSNTPSASDPTGATTGWQVACDPLSTSAQAAAGTNNASIMTPLLVAQQTALRALLAGSTSQVFNVATATAGTHAVPASQEQLGSLNYGGTAGGTANALTATLPVAPSAYAAPLSVVVQIASPNTGAVTINVNGLGVKSVVGAAHSALQGGELIAGGLACFVYDASLSGFILAWATGGAEQVGNAVASQQAVALGQLNNGTLKGVSRITTTGNFTAPVTGTYYFSGCAGGGGGGGSLAVLATGNITGSSGGGGAGQSVIRVPVALTAGQVVPCTIGAGGTAGAAGASGAAGAGGATQVGASGSIINLLGGGGGTAGLGGSSTSAWAGGAGGGGYPSGSDGSDTGNLFAGASGAGASGPFGGGGGSRRAASNTSIPGYAAAGFGSGGSGASGAYNGTATSAGQAGGAGAPGILIIEW